MPVVESITAQCLISARVEKPGQRRHKCPKTGQHEPPARIMLPAVHGQTLTASFAYRSSRFSRGLPIVVHNNPSHKESGLRLNHIREGTLSTR